MVGYDPEVKPPTKALLPLLVMKQCSRLASSSSSSSESEEDPDPDAISEVMDWCDNHRPSEVPKYFRRKNEEYESDWDASLRIGTEIFQGWILEKKKKAILQLFCCSSN
jgi:hypothetical protein